MNQLSLFDQPAPVGARPSGKVLAAEAAAKAEDDHARNAAQWQTALADARARWRVGMVTRLPIFATVLDSLQRYTQMLPGVVESIADDKAAVRIYAAPEYGYTLDSYPLHRKLAIDVPLVDLGRYNCNTELERIVAEGRLGTGDAELAARIRARGIRAWLCASTDSEECNNFTEATCTAS